MILPRNLLLKIDNALFNDSIIEAIRILRGFTGWELKEANDYIDIRRSDLERIHGRRIIEPPKPLEIDRAVLDKIAFIESDEVSRLKEAVYKLEKFLYGHNYEVGLTVSAVTLTETLFSAPEVIVKCFPSAKPSALTFPPLDFSDAKSRIHAYLTEEGDQYSGLDMNDEKRDLLHHQLIPECGMAYLNWWGPTC